MTITMGGALSPVSIVARDLPEAWFLCIREIMDNGYQYTIDKGSNAGQFRKELDMITLRIKYPGTRPLTPIVPVGIPAPVTMEYVDGYMQYLITSTINPNEEYTYGMYLEKQIDKVIETYKKDGFNNNQLYMAIGDKTSIFGKDPPCLRGIDTRVRYGALHFIVYFRSWDCWGGLPANLAGLQLLKEYMAKAIGVNDGEIIACSKGLHVYGYGWELANKILGR